MIDLDRDELKSAHNVLKDLKDVIESKAGEGIKPKELETINDAMWIIEHNMYRREFTEVLEDQPNETDLTIRKSKDGDYYLHVPVGTSHDPETVAYKMKDLDGRLLPVKGTE
jgi:hypothetical protein